MTYYRGLKYVREQRKHTDDLKGTSNQLQSTAVVHEDRSVRVNSWLWKKKQNVNNIDNK